MRRALLCAALVVLGCSGSDSGEDACGSACNAVVHFDKKAGIPLGADPVTLKVCHQSQCVELDVAVPAQSTTQSTGTDPALTASVERTTDPFYKDLQGVFRFDLTWSSATTRIAAGDYVAASVTAPDGGNVTMSGHTVNEQEVAGSCGCAQIEIAP